MAWEHVDDNSVRMEVPGGWLYSVGYGMAGGSAVFVPHPAAQGEKVAPSYDDDIKRRDELGAAYAHGFADASKPPTDELLEAMEELIATASEMIVPDAVFSNRDYAEADTVIRRAQRIALAFAKGGK